MDVIEVTDDTCLACDNNKDAPAFVRAYVYARYPSGVTAAFCASHGRQHRAELIAKGATILDLSHLVHE
ncbi:hypothetical protein LVJ59_17560 [Microbacterium sp. KKR3/1]|uniref:DUF7455 domain-containing protein n=1 Tax=Microbacterium sp. KKR3/1 TaxID=2904241 RepID=UPI001E3BC914|nr:hypothetical protein [Microbacterium sp. KKR3/1]MCE0510859.1 hypothetical protein [Microbacterium sp. KKR3/1]